MTEDNTNQGNPQESAPEVPKTLGAPVVDSSGPFDGNQDSQTSENQELSFEEVMFGENQSGTREAPQETHFDAPTGQPTQESVQQTEAEAQTESNVDPNDANRYQYWQSQAMKAQNQIQQMQNEWGPVVAQAQQNASMQQAQNMPNASDEGDVEAFPDAPERPTKPRSFSRADALEDSNSESARYLEDMDAWRDEMDDYNSLKTDYNNALMQEKVEVIEEERKKNIENAKKQQAFQQQNQQIHQHVQQKYQLNAQDAAEFVQWGNHPENLSMDNLVQLFRLQKGLGTAETQGKVAPPSQNFQQVQRAAQVPSPMGVVSGQTNTPQPQNPSDGLMDGLINFSNKDGNIF
jgi:hypothetical protein